MVEPALSRIFARRPPQYAGERRKIGTARITLPQPWAKSEDQREGREGLEGHSILKPFDVFVIFGASRASGWFALVHRFRRNLWACSAQLSGFWPPWRPYRWRRRSRPNRRRRRRRRCA